MSIALKRSKKLYYIFLLCAIVLIVLGIVVDSLYSSYSQVVNNALGQEVRASEEYVEAALENSKNINIRLESEGAVLLQNKDDVLPIAATGSTPVNVYGILSAHHYAGGTGSSSSGGNPTTLKEALESVGFTVNEAIWELIESSELGYVSDSTVGSAVAGQYELDLSRYEEVQSFANAKAYSEYAIVTFGTNGGEGADGDRGETNSLELGSNERALLERLDSEGFKVIALINSSYVMELGPVIEHADAILWIGGTGLYGMHGVADVIAGNANPSGRLVDTWMYEQETSSSYYTSDNTDSLYVDASGTMVGAYTNYNEGIYVGYRWYETADAEGYWDSYVGTYGTGYEGVVAFPFGYGLSYTQFSETIDAVDVKDGTITFTITAKNTGETAGKDVIELFVEKPYTNGGVEVAEVELIGFAKTDSLAPGGEETVTITVEEEWLASYDVTADGGNGCYVLAGGEYVFYLASAETGAHCWKTFAGDRDRSASVELDPVTYAGSNKRDSDAVAASNLLQVTNNDTGISCNDATAGFAQLSRKDGFANAAQTISKEANPNGSVTLSEDDPLYVALKANYGSNTYTNFNTDHLKDVSEFTDPSVDQPQTYTIADLYTTDADGNPLYEFDEDGNKVVLGAVDYDDPRWETLISQMSLGELEELIGHGGYGTIEVASIGKIAVPDYDGPTGFSNFLKASLGLTQDTTGFCSEPIMAATWDVDLIELYGEAVGIEGNAFGNCGWYAPGMNIHRTPFEGRTGEYFSEDPFITGMMGASVAYGAFQKGVYTYAKHFAFNEIEANRSNGMNCWMSEQTAREIYLRPFEIAIKQGKLTGMMSSFMFFNGQWNGGNFNLMTGIVRTEWNFKGVINTDLSGSSIMGAEIAVCAGTDMLLSTSYSQNQRSTYLRCDTIKTMDDGVCAMKTAAKHILFAYASAALNREVAAQPVDISGVMALFIVVNVVAYAGAAVLLCLFVLYLVRDLRSAKLRLVKEGADTEEQGEAGPNEENIEKGDKHDGKE